MRKAVQPGLPLPWEMVVHVLSFLRPRDLCSLALVSSAMNEESSRNDLWRPMCDPDWALVPADQCTPVVPPPLPGMAQTAAPTPPATAAAASSSGSSGSCHHHAMEEGWWKKRYMQQLRRFLAYCARRHGNTHKPEGRTLPDCLRHSRGPFKIAPLFASPEVGRHSHVASTFCRWMAPDFVEPMSIGYDRTTTRLKVDDISMELDFWFPGFGMIPWTFKSIHCLVLLYDTNARQSFERVEWNVRELYKLQSREGYQLERAFIVAIVGINNEDKEREVTPEEGRTLAAKLHADLWTEIPTSPRADKEKENLRLRLAAAVLPVLRPMAGDTWVKPTAAELDEMVVVPAAVPATPSATAADTSDKREARCLVQ